MEIENEVRFGDPRNNFNIDRTIFMKIKTLLDVTEFTTQTDESYRVSNLTYRKRINELGTSYIVKQKLNTVDNKDDRYRFSKSSEKQINQHEFEHKREGVVTIRNSQLYYRNLDDSVRIECKITYQKKNGEDSEDVLYTVEVEFPEENYKNNKYWKYIFDIVSLCLDRSFNSIILPSQIRKSIYKKINLTMRDISEDNFISSNVINKPIDLTYNNLTYESFFSDPKYSVSLKADGIHIFLIKYENYLVLADLKSITVLSDTFRFSTNFILEGELIMSNDLPTNIIVFDCIQSDKGSILNIDYHLRLDRMRKHVEEINDWIREASSNSENLIIPVIQKTVYKIETVDSFFLHCNNLLDLEHKLEYDIDGLIFTPNDKYYSNNRILKWKPENKLTIDFQVKDKLLYSKVDGKNDIVLFEGNSTKKYEQVELFIEDGIYEFQYNSNTNIFEMVRDRSIDKIYPNNLSTAKNIWDRIINPITEGTMRGKTNDLMRKYHNREKRELIDRIQEKNLIGSTLLDIGSGRGGDFAKWKNFSKILCIEPNEENIREFMNRLESFPDLQTKVFMCQCGAEETDYIQNFIEENNLPKTYDFVTSMFSLTFFWKNDEMLRGLATTILRFTGPKSIFGFVTMNGDIVSQKISDGEKVQFNDWSIQRNNEKIFLNFNDTIVGEQEEFLVHIKDLEKYSVDGKKLKIEFPQKILNKEKFLNPNEKRLTEMYSGSRAEVTSDDDGSGRNEGGSSTTKVTRSGRSKFFGNIATNSISDGGRAVENSSEKRVVGGRKVIRRSDTKTEKEDSPPTNFTQTKAIPNVTRRSLASVRSSGTTAEEERGEGRREERREEEIRKEERKEEKKTEEPQQVRRIVRRTSSTAPDQVTVVRKETSPVSRRDSSPSTRRETSPVSRRDSSPVSRRDSSPVSRRETSSSVNNSVVVKNSSPPKQQEAEAARPIAAQRRVIVRRPTQVSAPIKREEVVEETQIKTSEKDQEAERGPITQRRTVARSIQIENSSGTNSQRFDIRDLNLNKISTINEHWCVVYAFVQAIWNGIEEKVSNFENYSRSKQVEFASKYLSNFIDWLSDKEKTFNRIKVDPTSFIQLLTGFSEKYIRENKITFKSILRDINESCSVLGHYLVRIISISIEYHISVVIISHEHGEDKVEKIYDDISSDRFICLYKVAEDGQSSYYTLTDGKYKIFEKSSSLWKKINSYTNSKNIQKYNTSDYDDIVNYQS